MGVYVCVGLLKKSPFLGWEDGSVEQAPEGQSPDPQNPGQCQTGVVACL